MKDADELVREIKSFIDNDDIYEIERIYREELSTNTDNNLNLGYIYQKAYLHACLRQNRGIVEFLKPLFGMLSPIDQMTIRPMFSYGDFLLRKKK